MPAKCPKCGKSVSEDAPSCSRCDQPLFTAHAPPPSPSSYTEQAVEVPKRHPMLKWAGVGFVGFVILGIAIGPKQPAGTEGVTSSPRQATTEAPAKVVPRYVSEISPEQFKAECRPISGPMYGARCFGKRVLWVGKVTGVSDKYIHADVDGDSFDLIPGIPITSYIKSINNNDFNIYATVEFTGTIGERNIVTPDIINAEVLKITVPASVGKAAQEADSQKRKEERDARAAAEEQATAEEYAAKWSVTPDEYRRAAKGINSAAHTCKDLASKVAQYDWESQGFFHGDLGSWKLINSGEAILEGDNLRMKNGFGVWKIVRYKCKYDVTLSRVSLLSAR